MRFLRAPAPPSAASVETELGVDHFLKKRFSASSESSSLVFDLNRALERQAWKGCPWRIRQAFAAGGEYEAVLRVINIGNDAFLVPRHLVPDLQTDSSTSLQTSCCLWPNGPFPDRESNPGKYIVLLALEASPS